MTWLKVFWARLRGRKQPSPTIAAPNVSSRAENFTQMRAKRSERSYMREDSKSSQHADDFFMPLMASSPANTGYADLTPLFRSTSSGDSYSPAPSSTYQVESAKSDYCSSGSSYDSGSSYSSSSSDSCSSSSSSSFD